MLKQTITAILSAMIFAMGTAMADHHKGDEKDSHKGMEHPAHEMGEAADTDKDKNKKLSEEYKENVEEAEDAKNTPHPAHEMGESEEELRERGQ